MTRSETKASKDSKDSKDSKATAAAKAARRGEPASILPPQARIRPVGKAGPVVPGAGKVKSKAGWLAGFLTCLVLTLVGTAVLGAAIWFDLANLQTRLVTLLKIDQAGFQYLENKKSELATLEAELADRNRQQLGAQQDIDQQAKALEKVKSELAEQAGELAALSDKLSDKKTSLEDIVAIYETMDPDKAAQILVAAADPGEQLVILKNMDQNRLSLILAEMTPVQAAKLINLIAGDESAGG